MLAVLGIIILFCCLAAPGIRGLCKRYICRTCIIDDPDLDNGRYFKWHSHSYPQAQYQYLKHSP
nr:unnamed protein product [Callosobruchus analis]